MTVPMLQNCPIGSYPPCVESVDPRSVTNQENLSRFVWTQRSSGGCAKPLKKKGCPINRSSTRFWPARCERRASAEGLEQEPQKKNPLGLRPCWVERDVDRYMTLRETHTL